MKTKHLVGLVLAAFSPPMNFASSYLSVRRRFALAVTVLVSVATLSAAERNRKT